MYQSGFLGINQSLRLAAHKYVSGHTKRSVCSPLVHVWVTEVADLGHRSVAGLEGQGILGSVVLMGMLTHK